MILKVNPTKKEIAEHNQIVQTILSKIKIPNATAVLGGSGAKNTWLSGSTDIDIYVKFNYSKYHKKSDKLSNILEKYLKKRLKITKLHGSRDYFQTRLKGFTIEIVPILDIKKSSQAKNITDVSQLHVNYVTKHKKLANDIRLAKAFAKAQQVYGAESYIKGFSGYVLELLVIHYKSFKKLIKAASKWPSIKKIGKLSHIKKLNKSKTRSPLILIDPVQSDRNASAALSKEKYNLFIKACKNFSKNSLTPKEFSIKKLKSPLTIILQATPKKGKRDVVGAKLLKLFQYLSYQIEKHDFKITKKGWHWNGTCYLWYKLKTKKLPSTLIIQGPPLKLTQHVKIFKKKYKKTFTKNRRIKAHIKRKHQTINTLITSLIKEKHVKTLSSSIRNLYK